MPDDRQILGAVEERDRRDQNRADERRHPGGGRTGKSEIRHHEPAEIHREQQPDDAVQAPARPAPDLALRQPRHPETRGDQRQCGVIGLRGQSALADIRGRWDPDQPVRARGDGVGQYHHEAADPEEGKPEQVLLAPLEGAAPACAVKGGDPKVLGGVVMRRQRQVETRERDQPRRGPVADQEQNGEHGWCGADGDEPVPGLAPPLAENELVRGRVVGEVADDRQMQECRDQGGSNAGRQPGGDRREGDEGDRASATDDHEVDRAGPEPGGTRSLVESRPDERRSHPPQVIYASATASSLAPLDRQSAPGRLVSGFRPVAAGPGVPVPLDGIAEPTTSLACMGLPRGASDRRRGVPS